MSKMFCTQKTAEQMAEESRKATIEGMRQVAEALKRKKKRRVSLESSSSDESFAVSEEESTSKLEERIHYLQLDLSNAEVEKQDLKDELDALKDRFNPYKRLDEEIANLNNTIGRALKNCDGLTVPLLEKKLENFAEEFQEHSRLFSTQLTKLEYDHTRMAFEDFLAKKHEEFNQSFNALKRYTQNKYLINFLVTLLFILGVIKVVLAIVALAIYFTW